mmetsp:Transcript_12199/g.19795  ORF Transcript_12199/g.19795 Transcript_12199/m.19795 type:complete len:187 (-) Transcript_12199:60-620(-)
MTKDDLASSKLVERTALVSVVEIPLQSSPACLCRQSELVCTCPEHGRILTVQKGPCHCCIGFVSLSSQEDEHEELSRTCAQVAPHLHPRTKQLFEEFQNSESHARRPLKRPCLFTVRPHKRCELASGGEQLPSSKVFTSGFARPAKTKGKLQGSSMGPSVPSFQAKSLQPRLVKVKESQSVALESP